MTIIQAGLRFPTLLIMTILITFEIFEYADSGFKELLEHKLIFTYLMGIPLFFSIAMLLENHTKNTTFEKVLGTTAGALFLGLYYWTCFSDSTNNFQLQFLHISFAIHLVTSFIGFRLNSNERHFWEFNKQLFLRFSHSAFLAAVLFLGLIFALIAIQYLFPSILLKKVIYFKIWTLCAFPVLTWHFLLGVPSKINSPNTQGNYPKGLRLFVQYLLIPLVTLYLIILYVYMFKIIGSGKWPSGYVGWLVSGVSVMGVFNLLLINPEKNSRWIARYSRWFYILILPLLAMLLVGVSLRIHAYGVTEKRYILFVLGCLLTGLSLYFTLSQRATIKMIPISLFIGAMFSFWGPWNAYQISIQSQLHRAEKILRDHQLLVGNKTQPSKTSMNFITKSELYSILKYILRNHGVHPLKKWFPPEILNKVSQPHSSHYSAEVLSRYQTPDPIMNFLEIGVDSKKTKSKTLHLSFHRKNILEGYPLDEFHRIHFFEFPSMLNFNVRGTPYELALDKYDRTLTLKVINSDSESAQSKIKLESLLKNLYEKYREFPEKNQDIKDFTLEGKIFDIKYRLVFIDLRIERNGKEEYIPYFARGFLLLNL